MARGRLARGRTVEQARWSVLAIGLMSGTSLDGIDAALIETDGEGDVRADRVPRRALFGRRRADAARGGGAGAGVRPAARRPEIAGGGRRCHAPPHAWRCASCCVEARRRAERRRASIGFHGQTVAHRPDRGWTWQIGDGAALARRSASPVVGDFRAADVAAGGQGAPLLPVYHRALARRAGRAGGGAQPRRRRQRHLDRRGRRAGRVRHRPGQRADRRLDAGGDRPRASTRAARWRRPARVDEAVLTAMLDHPFFDLPPPKSLDRDDFTIQPARGLSAADGAATLTAFTAEPVALGLRLLPERPRRLIVAGGGRHNPTLMAMIGEACGRRARADRGAGLERRRDRGGGLRLYGGAHACAACRSAFRARPASPQPMTGGVLSRP